MAKSENNEVMYGVSGKVGNLLVFRNFFGRTIVAKRQRKSKNPTTSRDQQRVIERFKEAVIYAKGVTQDPVQSDFYRPWVKGPLRIFNLAMADFCKPPAIKAFNVDNYEGNIGDQFTIRAIDNFGVVSLKVIIAAADGTVLETGMATQAPNLADWIYTTTVQNATLAGTMITAKATDRPGNVATATQSI